MFIKKKLSISNIFFFNMILVATISSTVIGMVWIHHEQSDFKEQTTRLKAEYLATQKQDIKDTVENAINYINYKKALTEKRLREQIKERVYEAHDIAENIHQNNHKKLSSDQVKLLIKQALRPVRFFDNRNYYFIDDLGGNSILFPPSSSFEGKNLMGIVNKKGIRPFPDIIKLVKENGEGYYIYTWVKYTEDRTATAEEYPKITYFKLFEPYKWFIAVGEYLDYIESDIQKEILERVSRINLQNSEHINIHTYGGDKLVSNGKVLLEHINEWSNTDTDGNTFVQDQNKIARTNQGGFVYYNIKDKDNDTARSRISYSKSLSDQNWIISAGVYLDEVNKIITHEKLRLKESEVASIVKIIFIMAGLLLFAFILAKYISYKSKVNFKTFSDFFEKASTDSIRIDQETLHFSEFSKLAVSANKMIDDRRVAESNLQKSEALFRQLAENIREIFWVTGPELKEIIYISPAYEDVTGYSCESLYNKPEEWLDSIIQEDKGKVKEYLEKRSPDDISQIVFPEYRIIRPDGKIRWVFSRGFPLLNDKGELYRITGITEDITEKKQAEQAIQTIIESSAGIIGQDFFDKTIQLLKDWIDCDIALIGELTDTKTIKALSMVMDNNLNHDYSYPLAQTPCELVQKEGFCHYPENVTVFYPDDKDLLLFSANGYIGARIVNHNNEMIGILAFISKDKLTLPNRAKDILNIIAARISAEIERKRIEHEKLNIEEKLRQSQKMESVGTLAGGIAHDFNNILGIIIGNIELAIEDIPKENPASATLNNIRTASMRAADIVKQLLKFSHKNEIIRTPIEIDSLIKEAVKLLRASIPTTIEINLDLQRNIPAISADYTQIQQVIINLCTNAFHAMEKSGGILTIGLQEIELDRAKFNGFQDIPEGHYIQLLVSDTGVGIDPEILANVFDPYFTTKETGKGTGMGLAVVHGIVKNHDGAISIYSEPGKGTSIKVVFPSIGKSIVEQKDISSKITSGNENILFVDDETDLLEMVEIMLERSGYRIKTFTNPVEALAFFKSDPEQFDLLISDVTMPDMTGDVLSQKILEVRPDLPIILCSGFSERVTIKSAEEIGIKRYIEKPVDRNSLLIMMREVLDEAKAFKASNQK
jgi:two-component system cell cycle sensor histidine kinase/response regulator CckA